MNLVKALLVISTVAFVFIGCRESCLDDCENDYSSCVGPDAEAEFADFTWEETCDQNEMNSSAKVAFCNCYYGYTQCTQACSGK